jgi:hypothetical protein
VINLSNQDSNQILRLRVVDPDPEVTLWIRIRIGNPDLGSGSRGKKVKKFQWKNALFRYFLKKFYH